MTARARRFEDIREGESVVLERIFSEADVQAFAALTGDRNPLHVDPAFGAASRFGGCVVHGLLVASWMSTVVGMELPGRDALLLSQSSEFRKPVRPGDRLRMEAVVASRVEARRVLELRCTVTNEAAETVMTGKVQVMVLQP